MNIGTQENGDSNDEEKAVVTLPGIVQKIIPSLHPSQPEQAQIVVDGAQELYREIRIDNELKDQEGHPVKLKPGAEVEVTIEAAPEATAPATESHAEPKDGLPPSSPAKDKAKKLPG